MTHINYINPLPEMPQEPPIGPLRKPEPPVLLGWKCPSCGACNSPYTRRCACTPIWTQITYSTNNTSM